MEHRRFAAYFHLLNARKYNVYKVVFCFSLLALPWLAGCNLLFQTVAAEASPPATPTTLPPWLMPLTATPLPTPTATPLPTATPKPRVVVTDDLVNVRSQPSTDADILGTVLKDSTLEFLGQDETGDWYQVCCVHEQQGWIFHDLVQQQKKTKSVAASNRAGQAPVASLVVGWQTFESPELGFSVVLPGMPVKQTATLHTNVGALDYYLFQTSFENASYTLGFANVPNPTSDPDALLNSVRDDILATLQGTVSNELDNEKQGVPVHELTITPPNQRDRVLVQVYLKDTRLYILAVTTPKEFIQSDNVTRFFNSFQLLQK